MNKKKILSLALVMSVIATLSFGSLAWFTAEDSVTNKFMVAGSEEENPDDIFSVDVWEEGDEEDDGLEYTDILPGDKLEKKAYVKNTGAYDQYIRVKITISDAAIWQDVYKANMVPVTEFVDVDLAKVYGIASAIEEDNFVYYLYYNDILEVGKDMSVFNNAYISERLTQQQAAALKQDGFQIAVQADAVQTENVGDNVYDAFKTVGMEIPMNTAYAYSKEELQNAFASEAMDYIVLNADVKCLNYAQKILGTSAELYMNGKTLITAPGNDEYGFEMTGDLVLSGFGTLTVRTSNMQVEGTLTVYEGVTINGQGRIEDNAGALIPLN